jgi:hypothetical protein
VHFDSAPEDGSAAWGTSARAGRLTEAFAVMLRTALVPPGQPQDWFLFLEDDLDFHPRIASLVETWEALQDPECVLASLFNPSLRPSDRFVPTPRAFAAEPGSFLGAQALLVRRAAALGARANWERIAGLASQRLAQISGRWSRIWVHKPSLVQHVALDSSWGARVQKALDFDPGWTPAPPGHSA